MENNKKNIAQKTGDRIRYFRSIKKLSQEDLALAAEINPAYIGHIERGLKCPTVATLNKICTAMGISLSELLDFEPHNKDTEPESLYRINMELRKLNAAELESVANILSEIIKMKENSKA